MKISICVLILHINKNTGLNALCKYMKTNSYMDLFAQIDVKHAAFHV